MRLDLNYYDVTAAKKAELTAKLAAAMGVGAEEVREIDTREGSWILDFAAPSRAALKKLEDGGLKALGAQLGAKVLGLGTGVCRLGDARGSAPALPAFAGLSQDECAEGARSDRTPTTKPQRNKPTK